MLGLLASEVATALYAACFWCGESSSRSRLPSNGRLTPCALVLSPAHSWMILGFSWPLLLECPVPSWGFSARPSCFMPPRVAKRR